MNMKEAAQMAANQNGVITQTALNFQVNCKIDHFHPFLTSNYWV